MIFEVPDKIEKKTASFLVKTHVGQVPSGEIRIVKFILQSLGFRCRRERRTAKIIEDGMALRVTRAVNYG